MWNGKTKAVTFSYDDGVTQDIRLIDLFNQYGLKATFNLNSGRFGHQFIVKSRDGLTATHYKHRAEDIKHIYAGHEIAVHTIDHPTLVDLDEAEIIHQVEDDRLRLSDLCGYEVVGMAYPNGPNDDRVADILRTRTGVKYSRTVTTTHDFSLQDTLYRFNPTAFHLNFDTLLELGHRFLESKADTPQLFYIWGHAYELDYSNTWHRLEEVCRLLAGHDDIFYGTNREVLLGE